MNLSDILERIELKYDELINICNPRTGDCGSLAYAIQEQYGGELIGIYAEKNDMLPKHIVVLINDTYIDIDGTATEYQLYNEYISPYTTDTTNENEILNAHFKSNQDKKIHGVMFDEILIRKIKTILESDVE